MPIDLSKPYTAEDFGASFQPKPTTPIQFPGVSQEPILNSLSGPPVPPTGAPATDTADPDIAEILAMMKPQTTLQDQYTKLTSEIPQRKEPGWGTKIIAGLGTLQEGPEGSQAAAEQYRYQPYYQQMQGFNKKEAILKDLSDNERQANVNNRQIGATLLTDIRARKRLEETNRKNMENEANDRAVTEIRRQMELNPNLDHLYEEDGTILLKDRKSGQITRTPYKGQSFSDFQKLILANSGQAARDALNNEANLERDRLRAEYDAELARLRAQLKEQEDKNKPMSESDKLLKQYNTAQRIHNTNPDGGKYITLGAPNSNRFKLNKPEEVSGFWKVFGQDVEGQNRAIADKYIAIAKEIYGDDVEIPESVKARASKTPVLQPGARATVTSGAGGRPGTSGAPVTKPPEVPKHFIRFKDKATGKTGWVDPAQFNAKTMEKVP